MRQRFIQPTTLDAIPISEIQIDIRTRHQLEPLLVSLQHIFVTPDLNDQVFKLLEDAIIGEKKNIGRPGMSLWEIFVLGVVRLSLGTDYDALESQANNHMALRGILGVHKLTLFEETKKHSCQTLKDNVPLLTEELLQSINEVLVKHGHILKKKRQKKPLKSQSQPPRTILKFP